VAQDPFQQDRCHAGQAFERECDVSRVEGHASF
jgi:hypothetical protein